MKTEEAQKITPELLKKGRRFDVKELFQDCFGHKGYRIIVWSWGAHKWTIHKDYALQFTVSGRLHKGHVYVTLHASDTFTIYLTSNRGNIKHQIDNVYIDQLIDVLDRAIETKH